MYLQYTERDRETTRCGMEYTRYLDLQRWTTSFLRIAPRIFARAPGRRDAAMRARERRVAAVSASFFGFFDARPAFGRFFVAAEDTTPVGASVAVLDYGFWKTELGGRNVLGETASGRQRHVQRSLASPRRDSPASTIEEPPAVYIPITTFAGNQPR